MGEVKVVEYLSTFECGRSADVEEFLRSKAVAHEKSSKSRTFLIVDGDSDRNGSYGILAYFSLAIHIMTISNDVSTSLKKKLIMYYEPDDEIQKTPCYLIGQIGKNDKYPNETTGDEIIHDAIDAINVAHEKIGGRFIKVDCEKTEGLMRLYQENGFRFIQYDDRSKLNELVMFFPSI
jgi:hypothetical protein